MRTTISLDDDVQTAVDRLRRDEGIGMSEAVNRLVRGGLVRATRGRDKPVRFVQQTARLGIRLDVTSIADTLEHLDGPTSR
ncbi:MAG: ribbon-helix-helix protein, CopG family [Chloroflexi bacterium]|nr:ribbon-helix-helix protein, CopG family [Chloroflexota bacterium]